MTFFNKQNIRTVALCVAGVTGLPAQQPSDPSNPAADVFARRDDAKAVAAQDPAGAAHLRRAISMRGNLGATNDDSFRVVNVVADSMGGIHTRLQQYFQGVKVVNGMIISHQNARGEFGDYTNALKTRIDVATRPSLSSTAVLQLLARQTPARSADATQPKIELVVLPIMERYLISTGAAVDALQATRGVITDKPVDTSENDLGAPPDSVNSDQTARRVKSYHLAYQVRTAPGHDVSGADIPGMLYHLDANTGDIINQQLLEHHDDVIGEGRGKFSGIVKLNTWSTGSKFKMFDVVRNYSTFDDDRSGSAPENLDADNIWGDKMAFQGDSASVANRQTAMVDGMFGSRVYWDMMANVFNRRGPDNHNYGVNVYAHAGSNLDDAFYSVASGNISLGDGASRQALDCLGHENGHGLNDFTAELGGSGESGGLNESSSDIFGAMTTFYLNGGGFSGHMNTIPATGGNWKSVGSGRNMQKPSSSNKSQKDYWSVTTGLSEVHDAAAPNNRAFYFISQGSGASATGADYSSLLPWGMTGIGTQKAAQIWFDALTGWMPDDADYNDARTAVSLATLLRFGPASPEIKAVQNAYAGVNVGQRALDYPAMPPSLIEKEPNNSSALAMKLAEPTTPKPASAPSKLCILGGGTDDDWYQVEVPIGRTMTVRLDSGGLTDYDLEVFNQNLLVSKGSSKQGAGIIDQVTFTSATITYYIRVNLYKSQTPVNVYQLFLDWN